MIVSADSNRLNVPACPPVRRFSHSTLKSHRIQVHYCYCNPSPDAPNDVKNITRLEVYLSVSYPHLVTPSVVSAISRNQGRTGPVIRLSRPVIRRATQSLRLLFYVPADAMRSPTLSSQ